MSRYSHHYPDKPCPHSIVGEMPTSKRLALQTRPNPEPAGEPEERCDRCNGPVDTKTGFCRHCSEPAGAESE